MGNAMRVYRKESGLTYTPTERIANNLHYKEFAHEERQSAYYAAQQQPNKQESKKQNAMGQVINIRNGLGLPKSIKKEDEPRIEITRDRRKTIEKYKNSI